MPTDQQAAVLRAHGIQVTAQRLAVLRAVSSEPHVTADRVAEVVRTEIGTISLQSVYDALSVLVAGGLIRRIQPAGSPARFEGRVGDNHHHLICRLCGRVVDVDCAVGAAPCLTAADDRGYEIDEAEIAYWGRCPDCLSQARTTQARTTQTRTTQTRKTQARTTDARATEARSKKSGAPATSAPATRGAPAPRAPARAPARGPRRRT